MTETLEHLHPNVKAVAQLPNAERISWIHQERWIHYLRADQVLKRLAALLSFPPRDRMPCLLLCGATGMGKTTIKQKFVRDHPSNFDPIGGTTQMPVVAIQMPPEPLERDFYEEILLGMGSIASGDSNLVRLRHRIRTLARQIDLRMLIIDEIHSMLAGTFRQQRIFLNAIRFLANDLRLPLVCIGTEEAKQALMTDQQLADRFEAFELPVWRDDASFVQLLKSFSCTMPIREPSDLCDPKIRKRILSVTEGVTVRICRVIEVTAITAIERGDERIELDMFSDELATRSLVSISERHRRRAVG